MTYFAGRFPPVVTTASPVLHLPCRFPKELAAKIAIDEMKNFKSEIIEKVVFVCFDDENEIIYKQFLKEIR